MKITFVLSTFFLTALSILFLSAYDMNEDPDGKSGATGSPSEVTCADSDCHGTYTLNSGPGSMEIASPDLINWTYVPGESYLISVTVSQMNRGLFGLGFEALKSNGDNAGLLIAGSDTHIKSKSVGGYSRKSIAHDDNTGASNDSHTFTFTWNAPTTDVGDITFYVAGNACNNNGNEEGDYVYSTSQVVGIAMGIYELENDELKVEVYPNPFMEKLNISMNLNEGGNVEFTLFDSHGALVSSFGKSNHPSGVIKKSFDVGHLSAGSYMLQVRVDGTVRSSKILQKF